MKKYLLLSLIAALIFSFTACAQTTGDNSSSDIVSADEESSQAENEDKLKIKELEDELSTIKSELSEAVDENNKLTIENQDLTERLHDLDEQLKKLKKSVETLYENGKYISSKFHQKTFITVTLSEDIETHNEKLTIKYPDDTSVDILKDFYNIAFYQISPDGTKVIADDFEYEYTASIYLYDVAKRETVKLSGLDLPEYTTPAYLQWLDDRYFMFVVQLDHGSVVRGGDVYVYDTETEKCQPIIKNSYWPFQTYGFEVYDDSFVVINSLLYEETMNFTEPKHHILTVEEIYDLINSGKTVDLSKIEN